MADATDPPILALIVDYGGVLVRRPSAPATVTEIAGELGLAPADLLDGVYGPGRSRWRQARTGALPEAMLWDAAGRDLRLAPEQVDRVRRKLFDEVQVHSGLVATLWGLRPRVRLALVSNALPSFTDTWRRLGFLDLFHVTLNSSAVGLAKPAPGIFHAALGHLGVAPGACLCIDDQPENLDAAAALGMQTVRFDDAEQAVTAIRAITARPAEA